jgi:hypothetical protein
MHVDTHISEQDLLSEIRQATVEVVETSAHVERRLREARVSLGQLHEIEAPSIGVSAQTPPA